MKKIFILLALAQGLYCVGDAKTVDETTAKNVGYSFLSQKGSRVSGVNDLQMVYEATTNVNGATVPCFYVFNVNSNNGFVIVSGDDDVMPVLGYSVQNNFQGQNIRSNVAGWLGNYQKQIAYVIQNKVPAKEESKQMWNNLIAGRNVQVAAKTTSISPMLTTQWDQEPYYNALCPYSSGAGAYAVTGCVATATAQVMKYWNYPATGNGMHNYTDANFGMQAANFDTTSYDWNSMQYIHVTSNNTAIATLMYQVGVSVDMQYGLDTGGGSGSYVVSAESPVINCAEYALKTYFNYVPTLHGVCRDGSLYNNAYSESQWTTLLQTELDAHRPMLYSGFGNLGGHCWVCDGYDNTGMFHFNWGWSGQSDGYFTVDNLAPPILGAGGAGGDFNTDQSVVVGIQPPTTNNTSTNAIKMDNFISNNVSMPANYGTPFSLATKFVNSGTASFTGDFCAIVFNSADSLVDTLKIISSQSVAAGAATNTLNFNTTTGLHKMVSGLYHIRFYSRPTGGSWSLIADNTVGANHYINNANMSIGDETGLFLYDNISVKQNNVTTTTLTQGQPLTVKTNVATFYYYPYEFNGIIDASLYKVSDGSKVFQIGQSQEDVSYNNYYGVDVSYTSGPVTLDTGTYVLRISDEDVSNGQTSFETTGSMLYSNPVLVKVVYPVGIKQVTKSENITLYPNPASDMLNIGMEGVNATTVRITDLAGREVMSKRVQNQNAIALPVHGMAPGMYFVQIDTPQGVITKKVVIK